MTGLLLTLHVLFAAITIGALFVESLGVVMTLRLPEETHREGARLLQQRIHRGIYYPCMIVTLLAGLALAWSEGVLAERWLAWKLVLVVLLIGLGMLTGRALGRRLNAKPAALAVHILIFLVSAGIVALAGVKPF